MSRVASRASEVSLTTLCDTKADGKHDPRAITPKYRKSNQHVSGCGAVGSALPWGGRGRKFKSCHSDQKRRFARVSFLFSTFQHRFFHSTPTFFAPVPILDVCFAYQVLFAIRRPHSPNLRNVSLRPHGQSQDCLFLSAFQHRFFTIRRLYFRKGKRKFCRSGDIVTQIKKEIQKNLLFLYLPRLFGLFNHFAPIFN